ncbi:autotransporter outer membrane beta-barrel domain-containing protein [Sphingomonas sp. PAMC 26605]|uniref:autotransporter outer membrane beta-barrel domain-containing protein n=1 Tax=Sphingomonas sp. PAMC 26605 TaxID=1112214 RepID=UPI00026CCFE2|nr:autotransporter outer membrane beta-barrel domain-containing protein [Sphingomonas sp. PAMC 26605]
MIGTTSSAKRLRARALQTSAIVLALTIGRPAFAQCAPEPTPANGTVSCSGIDPNGLTVTTYGTTVVVPAGATVLGTTTPAVAVRLPSDVYGGPVTLTVAGRIDGGTQPGVSALWQRAASGTGFSPTLLVLTVAAGGQVGGVNAVNIGQAANSTGNTASAIIDNAGTLTGSSGIALLASAPNFIGFQSITNRATGTIGAISGPVGTISNAGTIDGGARSAVDPGTGTSGLYGDLTNTGSIVSTSSAATLANLAGRSLSNSGTIANRGTGAAITGESLAITNAVGGRISSAGTTAIRANTYLSLLNAGTITGNIVTAAAPSYATGSTIDSTAGAISGGVTFGAGDDTLIANFDGTRPITGITGAIDGGAGTDTLRLRFAADATLKSAIAVPANFERLILAPAAKVTTTLAAGFSAPAPLLIGGNGTVINQTTLTGTTQAVMLSGLGVPQDYPSFVNAGTIRTTAGTASVFAVDLGSIAARFENSGTISASGAGLVSFIQGSVVNSGTITAAGTGVSLFGSNFTNSGTIRSTGGIGLVLTGSSGGNQTNSGRIEGATIGAQLSTSLINTGTITSSDTGVSLSYYGVLDNRAGGVVTGGRAAISALTTLFGATVANAGTINGDVRLPGSGIAGDTYNGNRYFALPGGMLNGNLTLASSNTLITDIVNTGPGAFAGITGTVTGAGAALRYRVRTAASATLGLPAGFASVGYDLSDKGALTLTGGSAASLSLAGTGSVDLNATITATGSQPAIAVTSVLTAPGEAYPLTSALAITSRGALSLTHSNSNLYPYAAVSLGSGDSFINAGTITVTDTATTVYSRINAIAGGASVVNSGTISLGGAAGVSAAKTFTNGGSIVQIAGTPASVGVVNVGSLVNSGTIDVAGNAVLVSYTSASITNSGRIASSGTTAIATDPNGYVSSLAITNLAGGTIAGGAGKSAIQLSGGAIANAGTITGSVDLSYSPYGGPSYASGFYLANGGTLAGNLTFGSGSDTLIALNDITGVSGTIDGGAGTDLFIHARNTTGNVTLGLPGIVNFELQGVRALGADTIVTASAATPVASDLYLSGDGSIVNTASVNGAVRVGSFGYVPGNADPDASLLLAAFTNQGSIRDGFVGATRSFSNAGTIGSATLRNAAVALGSDSTGLTFANTGQIANGDGTVAVSLASYSGAVTASNSGTITGGLSATSGGTYYTDPRAVSAPLAASLTNSGNIGSLSQAVSLNLNDVQGVGGTISLANSGTIEATGVAGTGASLYSYNPYSYYYGAQAGPTAIAVSNSGTIRANGGGVEYAYDYGNGDTYRYTQIATGLSLTTATGTLNVANAAGGVIEATGARSVALISYGPGLSLTNAGTIRGGAGTTVAQDDSLVNSIGSTYLAGAIQTVGDADDRIVNTGTIIGSIALGGGNDTIENRGTIQGNVFLGAGDDTFLQQASASLIGTVDGGAGTDSLIVDATGGGTINANQFVNFERFSQIGAGNVTFSGAFSFNTIAVMGGDITVNAGQTLGSAGPVTITGSDANETVTNNGTIAGSIDTAGGNDRVVNNGTIRGAVTLGSGDDTFVEGVGSRVVGGVDGGAGTDLYTVMLAGDRSGIGQRTGFEQLAVAGTGTLTLALDQNFASIALAGTGLNLALGGFRVGAVTGSDAAEALAVDGDVASVALGGGDDQLSLGTTRAAGRYDGGTGNDLLRFTAMGPVTLSGSATGFERVLLTGNALTVTGTLGAAGAPLAFGDGDQQLVLASGGTIAGVIDLGAGNDSFRWAAGGILNGSVAGGAGNDSATIELAGDRTLAASTLTGFETLATEGTGTLSIPDSQSYALISANTDLAVLAGGSLTVAQLQFGAGNNRLSIAGQFAGSVDGGAGNDTIAVSGGSANAPVAFGTIANVESFGMSAGYATIAGSAALGSVDLSGGRLVGLAGSTIGASSITVRQGATFGSAGTVNGNITVAGTLSPGASPGTMTVNGNVALQGGSIALFELTSGVSDKLVVNGAVSIASGATLQIVPIGTLRPGASYDLITTTGGISGSFTTVLKPADLFGVLVQRADRIQLLGQFLGDASFSPQVARSIAYANAQLVALPATSPLFAAVPALLTSSGASNPIAFAQITPEAYASATQIGVDNALTLTGAARGAGFAASGDTPHAYTFAQVLGGWHQLGDGPAAGTAATRGNSYGFLGGLGFGDATWSVGAFGGYLNDRQQIDALGARTKSDGVVAGVHGRYRSGALGVTASILYDGGDARTERALPAAMSATGRYGLRSWVGDVSLSYGVELPASWALRPHVGVTYVRTARGGVVEASNSAFALTVARDRHVAGFADAGVFFGRSDTSAARFRPFVSLGARYQIEGQSTAAVAGYSGGTLALEAVGAPRARWVGTATAGIGYRLPSGLDLFVSAASQTGRDDHDQSATAGIRLRF